MSDRRNNEFVEGMEDSARQAAEDKLAPDAARRVAGLIENLDLQSPYGKGTAVGYRLYAEDTEDPIARPVGDEFEQFVISALADIERGEAS